MTRSITANVVAAIPVYLSTISSSNARDAVIRWAEARQDVILGV